MSQGFTRGVPIDTDPTLSLDSDLVVPSQKAVKTYVDNGLNTKQDAITLTTTGTSGAATLTGATLNIPQYSGGNSNYKSGLDSASYSSAANTAVYTQLITANTFAAGDVLRVLFRTRKTGALGTQTLRIYVNATADLLGTPILIAFYAPAGLTGVYNQMQRHIAIKSATILTEVIRTNANLPQDLGNDTFPVSSLVINWTLNRYFVFAIQNSSALDVNFGSLFSIERL
jgi:hypothetical protein